MPETGSPKKLFLIDTMSLVFRAFYAPMQMSLTSPAGMPVQAIFIFVRTLRKLLREHQPDFVAAAFDLAAPTFRDQLLESYKANRPAFPEDLAVQLPYVRRFCKEMGIELVEKEGFEADDIIGTLTQEGSAEGLGVFIVSGDEDLFQLVRENVWVLKPSRTANAKQAKTDDAENGQDRKDENLFDAVRVKETIGVEPSKVVDWLALTGDPSDNIPGARPLPGQGPALEPGAKKRSYIGPKGATELLNQFETLEAALDHWQDAKKQSYREALRDFRNEALLSKQLAAIRTDVELDVHARDLRRGEQNQDGIIALCRELGFTSLLREFMGSEPPAASVEGAPATELSTPDSIARWLHEIPASSPLALAPAFEGEEGFPAQLVGLGVADHSRMAFVPLGTKAQRLALFAAFEPVLKDEERKKAVHNAKLVDLLLRKEGIKLGGVAHDTMLYSYLLDPLASSHSLPDVLLRHKGMRLPDSPARAAAAIRDLAELFAPEVLAKGVEPVYRQIELPLAPVLADVETAGIRIDPVILGQMSREFEKRLAELTHLIFNLAGEAFDVNSPRQLGEILFEKLKLPGGKRLRKSGQYSTDASVLEALAAQHELPRRVLDYRTRAKLKSTYVDALPRFIQPGTERIHTSFNAAGSRTGRLSSSNPNLQNIPVSDEFGALIRSAFVAEPGWTLIAADYSQIELRVLAHVSQDPLLIEAFSRDEDIHSRTAQELFGILPALQTREHRRMAKAINYGVIYGLSSFGLAQRTGTSKAEAQHYIDEYFRRYKQVDEYLRGCVETARQTGEVRTRFGRLRPIPEIHSPDVPARNRAEREAMNTPLQGTAADLMKLAMVKLDARLKKEGMQTRIILTVHDELVLEAPEPEAPAAWTIIREEMEGVYPLRVPLRVEIGMGANWRDAK
ncbi:MAG: DNA polymerase I [Terriglobia bacterium]